MTQNEAKEYIANPNHWYVIGVTDYARVCRLDYGSLSYIAVQTKHKNITEWYRNKTVIIEWSNSLYYRLEEENRCLGYPIRPTEMSMEIWKESKK